MLSHCSFFLEEEKFKAHAFYSHIKFEHSDENLLPDTNLNFKSLMPLWSWNETKSLKVTWRAEVQKVLSNV